MSTINEILHTQSTAESRWARLGPYYAMFPLEFAFETIDEFSKKGDFIIDPFAGRFSSIFAGSVTGRKGVGIEINPVGWLYGKAKINPASMNRVLEKLKLIYQKRNNYKRTMENMPQFYRLCFCDEVLKFLLSARRNLQWKEKKIDATLMSIILVYLHGKIEQSLSNQMKMTKAMGMNYSINWWKEQNMETPPEINPYKFLKNRIEWRYEKGLPQTESETETILGDSTKKLLNMAKINQNKFSLLFTSPPYCSVTDYYSDQWLRYWMLGGVGNPLCLRERHKDRFNNKVEYSNLLNSVFKNCSYLMKEKSTIYVRTDIRQFTQETTINVLKRNFPDYKMYTFPANVNKRTQTDVMGNSSLKRGEIDIIMQRK